jgi:hypothetical protein
MALELLQSVYRIEFRNIVLQWWQVMALAAETHRLKKLARNPTFRRIDQASYSIELLSARALFFLSTSHLELAQCQDKDLCC